ncbi:MAG: hypothetical protein KJ720_07965 [Proteobacteria bacterium]|nr:hypothetical protein [Pseudomonadota bacterium]MBU2469656.1 hypothetical protein [Pseudomonadota bacterium]MBU2518645.1 hypothetical protein [Pseudomonadota bacterium]
MGPTPPFSEYQTKTGDNKYNDLNNQFQGVLKKQVIVDAYKYKTMLGTQDHPQYTDDDLETAIVFEYSIEQLKAKCGDKTAKAAN